jgi:hypothetical protein
MDDITRWKYEGAPFSPIGTLNHWNIPNMVMKAVKIRADTLNGAWW